MAPHNPNLHRGKISAGSAIQRLGTGGYTYSVRSSTGWTTSNSVLISTTLNIGVYLVTLTLEAAAVVTATYISGSLCVGGTSITPSSLQGPITGTAAASMNLTIPVVITANSTVVAGYGQIGSGSTTGGHEMWVVRIA